MGDYLTNYDNGESEAVRRVFFGDSSSKRTYDEKRNNLLRAYSIALVQSQQEKIRDQLLINAAKHFANEPLSLAQECYGIGILLARFNHTLEMRQQAAAHLESTRKSNDLKGDTDAQQ